VTYLRAYAHACVAQEETPTYLCHIMHMYAGANRLAYITTYVLTMFSRTHTHTHTRHHYKTNPYTTQIQGTHIRIYTYKHADFCIQAFTNTNLLSFLYKQITIHELTDIYLFINTITIYELTNTFLSTQSLSTNLRIPFYQHNHYLRTYEYLSINTITIYELMNTFLLTQSLSTNLRIPFY
jgi:hypothetical protein